MHKQFLSLTLVTGLLMASIAPSWAIGFSDIVEKQAQGAGERFIGNVLNSAEKKASKEADNTINGSPESQKPPKSQDNSAPPPYTPDTARSNQVSPQGTSGQVR
jgi:hypothetical protein